MGQILSLNNQNLRFQADLQYALQMSRRQQDKAQRSRKLKSTAQTNSFNKFRKPIVPITNKKNKFIDQFIQIPSQINDENVEDNRQKIKQMVYPYSAIGRLQMTYLNVQKYSYVGTGSLIYDNIVITCAHNIYDKKNKRFFEQIFFSPALNGDQINKFEASIAFVPDQYIQLDDPQNKDYDFGMLVLSVKSLSDQFGYLAISDKEFGKGQEVEIAGYPLKNKKTNYMYRCKQRIIQIKNKKIQHMVSTTGGQSGSPLLNSDQQIVGIHTSGSLKKNCAILLDHDNLLRINKWYDNMYKESSQRHLLIQQQYLNEYAPKISRYVPDYRLKGKQAFDAQFGQFYNQENDPEKLVEQAEKCEKNNDPNKALKFLEKALKICQDKEYNGLGYLKMRIHKNLGHIHCWLGNLNAALVCNEVGLQLAIQNDSLSDQVAFTNSKAYVKYSQGEYTQALELHNQNIEKLKNRTEDLNNLAVSIVNKVQILIKLNKLQAAQQLCLKLQKMPKYYRRQQQINNFAKFFRGSIHLKKREIEKASECFSQCQKFYQDQKNQDANFAQLKNKLGQLERQKGNFEAAQNCYKKGLQILQKRYGINVLIVAQISANLGYLYYEYKHKKKAFEYLNKAKKIYQEHIGQKNKNLDYFDLVEVLKYQFQEKN